MLSDIPKAYGERILASWNGNEDAAVFELDSERLGVLTVDFITPVVDDPYTWGQIAASNSLSDVFAMGGRPIVALNVVCFPTKYLELDVLKSILEGGFERVSSSGAFLVGGHSVQDDEPKYGLVVYGEVMKSKLWRTSGARAGDKLILTKPVGTGIAITAIKADMIDDEATRTEATASMRQLNTINLPASLHGQVHAATDVTGFGLAGHLHDMLGETLDCELSLRSVPAITGVKSLADMGLVPEGAYRNMSAYESFVDVGGEFEQSDMDMLYDAQTSGGLLLAVSSESSSAVLSHIRKEGFSRAEIIGVFSEGTGRIALREKRL